MSFPKFVSLTLTNKCNLKCQMCGQWSKNGYMHGKNIEKEMELDQWKKIIDEISENNINSVLLRGGETFLYPQIIELLKYINQKNIFISIDTNGTNLKKYAKDLLEIGNIHLTISIDGPQKIHDEVRGIKGSFKKTKEGVLYLHRLEKNRKNKIGKSINFTISPYSYKGLGKMPDVARSLKINTLCIVPFYYVSKKAGEQYKKDFKKNFNCNAYSWMGFHHEHSMIDFEIFKSELIKYKKSLGDITDYPFLVLTDNEYKSWFDNCTATVKQQNCFNIENLIDIQPNGDANFCVDFPDYIFGNVKKSTIKEIWNSKEAEKFREYRRKNQLGVCYRCGAKYMSANL